MAVFAQRFSRDEDRQLPGSRAGAQLPQQVFGIAIGQEMRGKDHARHVVARNPEAVRGIRREHLDAKFLEPAFQELSGGADRNR